MLLVKGHADANVQDEDGEVYEEMVIALRTYGAKEDIRNKRGKTYKDIFRDDQLALLSILSRHLEKQR